MRKASWIVLLTLLLVVTGCGQFAPAAEGTHGDMQMALIPAAEGWTGETLTVMLTDAAGAPITDATVAVEGNMNHAGMVPVLAAGVTDDADGAADGRYQLPFGFTMLGDWIITVDVTLADGGTVSRDLPINVSEAGVTGDAVMAGPDEAHGSAHDHDADHDTDHDADHEHATGAHASVVHAHDVKARPGPMAGGNSAVYFLLHNGGDAAVRLTGADTTVANAVEIHETADDNGIMRMRQLADGILLGPDESVTLQPGGLHVMLIGLTAPLAEGDVFDLTLHFDDPTYDFTVEVTVVSNDELSGGMTHNH